MQPVVHLMGDILQGLITVKSLIFASVNLS